MSGPNKTKHESISLSRLRFVLRLFIVNKRNRNLKPLKGILKMKHTVNDVTKTMMLSLMVIFPHNNFSRKDGNWFESEQDQKNIIQLLINGFNLNVSNFLFRDLTKEELPLALQQRQTELDELEKLATDYSMKFVGDENKTTLTPSERLRVFKDMYVGKNGKLIQPTFEPIYAFRRLSSINLVNAFLFKKSLPLITEVTGRFRVYPDTVEGKLDRVNDCVDENVKKNEGAKQIDWKDRMRIGFDLKILGANQARIRRVLGDGNGQKVDVLLEVNHKFPELKVLENIQNDTLNVTSCKPGDIRDMLTGNKSGEEILSYIKDPTGNGSPIKPLSKKEMEPFTDNYPCDLVAFVVSGIVNRDLSSKMAAIAHMFPELNKITAPLLRKPINIVKENAVALEEPVK